MSHMVMVSDLLHTDEFRVVYVTMADIAQALARAMTM